MDSGKIPTGKKYTELRNLVDKYDLLLFAHQKLSQLRNACRGYRYFHDFRKYLYSVLCLWGSNR